jgi:signal transduction histidine kinase
MSGWIIGGCLLVCLALAGFLTHARRQLRASREAFEVLSEQAPLGIRERVRLMGGECQVESHPGRGTRLDVCLPLETDAALIRH